MLFKYLAAAAAASALALTSTAAAAEPGKVIVSLYRAVPGKQVALLKWMEQQGRAVQAAGVPAAQVYVHTSGDTWDFMVVNPQTTREQDDAVDAAAKKMGISYGAKASIEFRTMIASHTDTLANGPMSTAEILADLGEK